MNLSEMPKMRRFKWMYCFLYTAALIFVIDFLGILHHVFELDYHLYFHYGNNEGEPSADLPLFYSNFSMLQKPEHKCTNVAEAVVLTILVKSSVEHFARRAAIRHSWGFEQRFSDIPVRCVFLLGRSSVEADMKMLQQEAVKYADIVQTDFEDSYFNNTIKTVSGLSWAYNHCSNSHYYLFVDDDYYVSVKNILKFLANPLQYPEDLYETRLSNKLLKAEELFAGYVFQTAPHRHKFSKWYVSLAEYPFDLWPPYVTAGAFVLTNSALKKLYRQSLQTRLFRFDDIFLGIVALHAKLKLTHCQMFYFKRPAYKRPVDYRFVIASHGFDDPNEMQSIWAEIRSGGYA